MALKVLLAILATLAVIKATSRPHWNREDFSWECTSLNGCDQPDLAEAKDEKVLAAAKTKESSHKVQTKAEGASLLAAVADAVSTAQRHKASGQSPISLMQTDALSGFDSECVDDDACLQAKSGWGSSYTCAGSTQYCYTYGATTEANDMECCPKSCDTCPIDFQITLSATENTTLTNSTQKEIVELGESLVKKLNTKYSLFAIKHWIESPELNTRCWPQYTVTSKQSETCTVKVGYSAAMTKAASNANQNCVYGCTWDQEKGALVMVYFKITCSDDGEHFVSRRLLLRAFKVECGADCGSCFSEFKKANCKTVAQEAVWETIPVDDLGEYKNAFGIQ